MELINNVQERFIEHKDVGCFADFVTYLQSRIKFIRTTFDIIYKKVLN